MFYRCLGGFYWRLKLRNNKKSELLSNDYSVLKLVQHQYLCTPPANKAERKWHSVKRPAVLIPCVPTHYLI